MGQLLGKTCRETHKSVTIVMAGTNGLSPRYHHDAQETATARSNKIGPLIKQGEGESLTLTTHWGHPGGPDRVIQPTTDQRR